MDDRQREVEIQKHLFGDDGCISNDLQLLLLARLPWGLAEPERGSSHCKELLAENA